MMYILLSMVIILMYHVFNKSIEHYNKLLDRIIAKNIQEYAMLDVLNNKSEINNDTTYSKEDLDKLEDDRKRKEIYGYGA